MSKRKFMNCHNNTIDRWSQKFGSDPVLSVMFNEFHNLVETRQKHAVLVREMDVSYSAGGISKAEYREGKRPYEAELKNIKPKLRKIFDQVFCNLLVMGNDCKCYICGEDLDMTQPFNRDHVFPKVMGFGIGGNMMPAHYHCNQGKDQRLPHDTEVLRAVRSYEYAEVPFNPRKGRQAVAKVLPEFSVVVPEFVRGQGFRYV
jgi:hypothetical protein